MEQPRNYDTTPEPGSYTPPELGGHYMIIQSAKEGTTKNGAPMIIVYLDFASNDKQSGLFMKQYKEDTRDNKTWPFAGTQWIQRDDAEGNCSKTFKGFITSVEKSNPGFNVTWGDNFGEQFKGKRVGGIYGKELDFYNGKERKRNSFRWFCSIDKVDEAEIPETYETKEYKKYKENKSIGTDGFMDIPDGISEELPF